ncbi:hypothetical protein JVT61DRAFT_2084 [Boletus reticuloceps]|uniref:OTU domain-containing protein n=1 Tax=Boletus reticuloceps TaxID=495285 RepID=A0A8I2YRI2_9AGAM|nr:hypothetical protein JVT61DRAFT_2084 [Boletus reticuloceps]
MPTSKRNKSKKFTPATPTSTLPSQSPLPGDESMDDLFAELDLRDKQSQPESQDTPEEKVEEKIESGSRKQNSKVRHLARQARKAAALAQNLAPSNPEADAQVDREIKLEGNVNKTDVRWARRPNSRDGHCLFSAIADQLALLNVLPANEANYPTVRAAASGYISQHPDVFLPFLPSISGEDGVGATENSGLMDARQFEQYCLAIKDTAAWGGEPEILALSRAYNAPIQVIQAGTPSVVTHTPDGNNLDLARDAKIIRISFHRRMYGLGEHYNSLRPKNALTTVADKIHLMLS